MVYPMAIRAYCPPSEMPESRMEIPYCTGIPPFLSELASGKDRLQKGRAAAPFEAVPSRKNKPPGGGYPARLAGWQAYSTVWTVSSVQALLAVSAVLI